MDTGQRAQAAGWGLGIAGGLMAGVVVSALLVSGFMGLAQGLMSVAGAVDGRDMKDVLIVLVAVAVQLSLNVLSLGVASTVVLGGYRLHSLRSLGFVRATSVIAIVAPFPLGFASMCTGCGCWGWGAWVPVGVASVAAGLIALIVTSDPDVVSAFDDRASTEF